MKGEIKDLRTKLEDKAPELLKRRTVIGDAPVEVDVPVSALIDKEPITVVLSKMGWIRAIKGHNAAPSDVKFKAGDARHTFVQGHTTDKFIAMTEDGRAFTLSGDKLPGGRGFGGPVADRRLEG